MIDNFSKIESLLRFNNKDDFYFIQLIKRKKDHPEMNKHLSIIRRYYIYSLEEFNERKEQIINFCKLHGARAYINLNIRNAYKVGMQTLNIISDNLMRENYRGIEKAWRSACGKTNCAKEKIWVIDIDSENMHKKHFIMELVRDGVIAHLYTKNGCHLLTHPFKLDAFKQKAPGVDVHKDGPTILWCE